MASDSGVPNERLDERLAAARDSALLEGEQIVAQEEGDRGQGIVLTNSRVLIIKVGITATGVANGKVVGEFGLPQITAVNVRKGPLGAVIQICTQAKSPAAPGATPDNVVVFTGSQRMRKCESIAAKIESALGKPVGRFESSQEEPDTAAPETPPEASHEEASAEPAQAPVEAAIPPEPSISDVARGGGPPRSLADEIFAEVARAQSQAAQPPAAPVPGIRSVGDFGDGAAQQGTTTPNTELVGSLHPNPNLPKPVHRRSSGDRVLMLFALLIAALVIGVAAVAPLRVAEETPTISVSWSELTSNPKLLRRHRDAVARFARQAQGVLDGANRAIAALESALRSGNKAAVAAAVRANAVDSAWRRLNALKAPPGLAGAKEQMASGLFVGKTAVANLSSALQSSTSVDAKDFLAKFADARSLIGKGLGSIEKTRGQLDRQLAHSASPSKRKQDRARFAPRRKGQ